jgi:uncharacterized protein (TIGR03067 family)
MKSASRRLFLASLFSLIGASSLPADEPAKTDQELLQGTWICTATIKDGQPSTAYVGVKAVFDGANMVWHFPMKDGTYQTKKCGFRIDPTKSPKHFDWWGLDKPQSVEYRLYSVTATELRWSTQLDYKTRPQALDQGKWQFTMKRVAEGR